MDVIKWMEPVIIREVELAETACDEANKGLDDRFRDIAAALIAQNPSLVDDVVELSDLFYNRRAIIEKAYRLGFSTGLVFVSSIDNTHTDGAYPQHPHNSWRSVMNRAKLRRTNKCRKASK